MFPGPYYTALVIKVFGLIDVEIGTTTILYLIGNPQLILHLPVIVTSCYRSLLRVSFSARLPGIPLMANCQLGKGGVRFGTFLIHCSGKNRNVAKESVEQTIR